MATSDNQKIADRINYHGSKTLVSLSALAIALGFLSLIWEMWRTPNNIQLNLSILSFSAITMVLSIIYLRSQKKENGSLFTAFFLISTFTLLITMRLAGLAGWRITVWILTVALALKVMNYVVTAYNDLHHSRKRQEKHAHHNTVYEWQLLFIRMFIGFDLVPHFTEKLFAGPTPRLEDIKAFTALGVHHPAEFVIIAGLIEFAGAFSLGCGFLTRLGAICLFIYLMVASAMGHHFSLGFIWASPGGGWEYPVLWSTLILSFALFGGSGFSLDHMIRDNTRLPKWVRYLMGSRHL